MSLAVLFKDFTKNVQGYSFSGGSISSCHRGVECSTRIFPLFVEGTSLRLISTNYSRRENFCLSRVRRIDVILTNLQGHYDVDIWSYLRRSDVVDTSKFYIDDVIAT